MNVKKEGDYTTNVRIYTLSAALLQGGSTPCH